MGEVLVVVVLVLLREPKEEVEEAKEDSATMVMRMSLHLSYVSTSEVSSFGFRIRLVVATEGDSLGVWRHTGCDQGQIGFLLVSRTGRILHQSGAEVPEHSVPSKHAARATWFPRSQSHPFVGCQELPSVVRREQSLEEGCVHGDIPSELDYTGGVRVLAYLDPSEERHTKLKTFVFEILKTNGRKFLPKFHKAISESFQVWESNLAKGEKASFTDENL